MGQYVISNHSINHPKIKQHEPGQIKRGELLSSGFIIRSDADSSGTFISKITYIAQLGSSALNLVITDLVGQSRASIESFEKFQHICDKEYNTKLTNL